MNKSRQPRHLRGGYEEFYILRTWKPGIFQPNVLTSQMEKLRPEKGSDVTKIHSPPNAEPAPHAEVPKCPCAGASPGNQGRPPCPQRVHWHIKCHLDNSHKPTLLYAAHGKRTRATFTQSITRPTQCVFCFRLVESPTGSLHGE